MSQVDIQIYGVHARDHLLRNLTTSLDMSMDDIHYDDRPDGGPVLYTAKKAWLSEIPSGVTHRIALADDVECCNNFKEIAKTIANTHPKSVVSFFPHEFMLRVPDIETSISPYFQAHCLFGAAIMIPIEYLEPCFTFIEKQFDDRVDDDVAIHEWCRRNDIEVLTTVPSIVQHIGDESILEPGKCIRRTVYYSKEPNADWNSSVVMRYRRNERFFSKNKALKGVLEVVHE